ncbi:MAG: hypothetical protein ACRDYA_09335, partial [Egibacteraceae bacterium]
MPTDTGRPAWPLAAVRQAVIEINALLPTDAAGDAVARGFLGTPRPSRAQPPSDPARRRRRQRMNKTATATTP